jgi:hypothetical protein
MLRRHLCCGHQGARSPRLVIVAGHAAAISAGEWRTAIVDRIKRPHPRTAYSRPAFLRTSAPNARDGIEKYLGSGMIGGIGSVYARKPVKAFGTNVLDVIELNVSADARSRALAGAREVHY